MMYVDDSKTNGPSKVTIIFCLSLKPRECNGPTRVAILPQIAPLSKISSQEQREECNVSYIEDLTKIHRFRAQGQRVNDPEKRQSHWVER